MAIQKTVAKKISGVGKKIWGPGGCLPPALRPEAVKKMMQQKLTKAGASFNFDSLTLKHTKNKGVWAFKGTATRRPFFGRHKIPLGGERLEVKGVFDAMKQEFVKYSEKVLALLRAMPKQP